MTASISNRKRSREDDANTEDHVPLSKRINMLHINNGSQHHNGLMPNGADSQSHQHLYMNGGSGSSHHQHNGNHQNAGANHNGHMPSSSHHHSHQHQADSHLAAMSNSHVNSLEDDSTYSPELNQVENPYYYNKNKLLFELHLERSKRNMIDGDRN